MLKHGLRGRGKLDCLAAGLLAIAAGCSDPPGDGGSLTTDTSSLTGSIEPIAPARDPTAPKLPAVLFTAPQFELTDQFGESFGSADLRGHVWVVNFIFTRCAATCPRQTEKLSELQQLASRYPDWDRVRLLSITVDPRHDTPERLHKYAERHLADHAHWKFLTGDRRELWRISKEGFKLPVEDSAENSESPITHSARFILVDSGGQVRGYYDSLSDEEFAQLHFDLRAVLSQSHPAGEGTTHVPFQIDVLAPLWLDTRADAQLATRNDVAPVHDFQFMDRLPASGIQFVHRIVPDAGRNIQKAHYDHGNGLAAADVDGDGLVDLYFLSQVGGNQLWRNLGNGQFEDITGEAGVGLPGRVSVSASFADTDNDGDPDLYVTTTRHGNVFLENDGQGRFRDRTAQAGLEYAGHSSSAVFFDYDRDGRLDLFLTNVGDFTTEEVAGSDEESGDGETYYVAKPDAFAGHLFPERSERSILYRNTGNNRFLDVTAETGLVDDGWSGDAVPIDVNDDGWVDLYVLNMQGNDECYVNVEGRRFERLSERHFSRPVWGGMGAKAFDYDNDGRLDLFVTNMHADMWELHEPIMGPQEKQKPPPEAISESYLLSRLPRDQNILGNALYANLGEGRYSDVSDQVGVENFWPWGPSIGDLNADGWQDLFITSSMNYPFRYHVNSVLLNDAGRGFQDAEFLLGVEPRRDGRTATPWFELDCSGDDAAHPLCAGRTGHVVVWGSLGSRSSVIVDLDQDGDLDIVTNEFNSAPQVLISDLAQRHPTIAFLKVKLCGTRANRDGLGARVQVQTGGRRLTQVHDGQSGYLSQSSMPLYFGLGDADAIDEVAVDWPSGTRQVLSGPMTVNQTLVIVESATRVDLRSE